MVSGTKLIEHKNCGWAMIFAAVNTWLIRVSSTLGLQYRRCRSVLALMFIMIVSCLLGVTTKWEAR